MHHIKIGPAGTGIGAVEGTQQIKGLGLDTYECEFTYGVRMSVLTAKEVGALTSKLGMELSIHAPYYINLASEEKEKIGASKQRILQSCERGYHMHAKYIVFHAAFYGKRSREEVYAMVKKAILEMQEVIKQNKWDVVLAPETTGKKSQFGDLDELLRLRKETGCELCVDFAHVLARDGKRDYDELFEKLKAVKHLHIHFSGIEYTEKGERRHKLTEEKEIKELLQNLVKRKIDATIINESPDPVGDSLKTKEMLKKLQ